MRILILCITLFINSIANAEIWLGPKLGFPSGLGIETEIAFDKVGVRSGVGVVPIKGLHYSVPVFFDYYFNTDSYCDGFRLSLGGVFDNLTYKNNKKLWGFSPAVSIGYGLIDDKFERLRYVGDIGGMLYNKKPFLFASVGFLVSL